MRGGGGGGTGNASRPALVETTTLSSIHEGKVADSSKDRHSARVGPEDEDEEEEGEGGVGGGGREGGGGGERRVVEDENKEAEPERRRSAGVDEERVAQWEALEARVAESGRSPEAMVALFRSLVAQPALVRRVAG